MVAPKVCLFRAHDVLMEYARANYCEVRKSKRDRVKWVPHDNEVIKINVGAAVNLEKNRVGLGLVARIADSSVLMAASKSSWAYSGMEHAEIDAFLWAVQFAKVHGWKQSLFEGDAKVIVEALQGSYVAMFIIKCWEKISRLFLELSRNLHSGFALGKLMVAYRLARWGSTSL